MTVSKEQIIKDQMIVIQYERKRGDHFLEDALYWQRRYQTMFKIVKLMVGEIHD